LAILCRQRGHHRFNHRRRSLSSASAHRRPVCAVWSNSPECDHVVHGANVPTSMMLFRCIVRP
jgi:hypothetical protein